MTWKNKKWENFLEKKGWAVGISEWDCKFFLYDENEEGYEYDEGHPYYGYTPIICDYDSEQDMAEVYGFR